MDWTQLQHNARLAAKRYRLPFRGRAWNGNQGQWMGTGIGSSVDFQDHRPYIPGDDPRYINWAAYARSGNYSMKLYQQEASPTVDIVFDITPSMCCYDEKRLRSIEVALFCLESALMNGCYVRLYLADDQKIQTLSYDVFSRGDWAFSSKTTQYRPAFDKVPWRHSSFRVVISDLLTSDAPTDLLRGVISSSGRVLLCAPWHSQEAHPDWDGIYQLIDCELGHVRQQRVSKNILNQYEHSYCKHFQYWEEESTRRGVMMARISSDGTLMEALDFAMKSRGVLELWN